MFTFKRKAPKKRPSLSLDLNSDRVTVAYVEKTDQGIELINYGFVNTPPNTIHEGLVLDPQLAGQAISDAITNAGISLNFSSSVNLCIPGQSTATWLMPIPTGLPADELADIVAQEAHNHIPFPVSEAGLDWAAMPPTERTDPDGVNRNDVILTAVQKTIIDSYWRTATTAHLTINTIDTTTLATIRGLAFANYLPADNQIVLCVNIRPEATDINLVRMGMPLFSRTIIIGSKALSEAVAHSLSISPADAINIISQVQLDGLAPETNQLAQASQIIRTIFSDIADEINRSIEFYRSQVTNVHLEKIVLSGSNIILPQISQFIAHRLNMTVEIADPLRAFTAISAAIPEEQRTSLTNLIGLAIDPLWLDMPTVNLNLNKDGPSAEAIANAGQRLTMRIDLTSVTETPWLKPTIIVGTALFVVALVIWMWFSWFDIPSKSKEIANLQAQATSEQAQLKNSAQLKEETALLLQKKDLLNSMIKQRLSIALLVDGIGQSTPKGVQLNYIHISDESIIVAGVAADFTRVSHFAINLSNLSLLAEPTIEFAKRDSSDPRLISFEITTTLKHNNQIASSPKE